MREFGILGARGGIGGSFSDITSLASSCRYRDCTHTNEPSCAVLEAVKSGEISQEHYDNYIKLTEESEFYQASYAERRKRDRDFGRYIRWAKKDLKDE
jgi:ribosome biogenesis GTPase